MVSWLALSLLSALFYGLTNAIDKQIVGKHLKDYKACIFIAVCFDIFYAFLIALFMGFSFSTSVYSVAAIISGALGTLGGIIWYYSLRKENVSVVTAIGASGPLYTFLLAVLFLGESLALSQVIGIVMLVAGSMVVSIKSWQIKIPGRMRLLPAFLMAFIWGASSIFTKYSLGGLSFWQSIITRQIGNFMVVLPIGLLLIRQKRLGAGVLNGRNLSFFGASEAAVLVGLVLFVLAASLGPISLISAVGSITPLLTLFWIFLLGRNHIATNELGRENLKPLLMGALLIMGGIYLIS